MTVCKFRPRLSIFATNEICESCVEVGSTPESRGCKQRDTKFVCRHLSPWTAICGLPPLQGLGSNQVLAGAYTMLGTDHCWTEDRSLPGLEATASGRAHSCRTKEISSLAYCQHSHGCLVHRVGTPHPLLCTYPLWPARVFLVLCGLQRQWVPLTSALVHLLG